MESIHTERSTGQVFRYFFRLVHKLTPKYISTLIGLSLFKTLRPLIFIFGPKWIVDELMGLKRIPVLIGIIGVIAGVNFILSLFEKILSTKCEVLTNAFNNSFERYISEKTVDLDFENIEDPDVLNLKERALFAVRNHGLMFGMIDAMSKIVNETFLILALSVLIWTFSPWVFVLVLAIVWVNSFLFKKIQKLYYLESTGSVGSNRAFVYYITQSGDLEIAKDVRLYKTSKVIIDKMNRFNYEIYSLFIKIYGGISRLNGFVNVNAQIQMVAIYALLVYKAIKGSVTVGNFMLYAGAVGKFSASLNTFVSSFMEAYRISKQLQLLVAFEDIPTSDSLGDCDIPQAETYEIEFHDVSFKYPRAANYTLKNISVRIRPGEKISIIGLNGAGKTTFVKLLTRLYRPTTGRITLNGLDIQTLKYQQYMKLISAVFQDYKLLGLSIAENITGIADTGQHAVQDEHTKIERAKLDAILKDVGMYDDVYELPNGAQTMLDKGYDRDATKFSGGQSQKLTIARALYKEAPIVILDEPTAALDPVSEYDIYSKFDQLVQNRTAIYISHRLSSCRFCDRILVFENGEIVQSGHHDQLIHETHKPYASLFNAQAQFYTA